MKHLAGPQQKNLGKFEVLGQVSDEKKKFVHDAQDRLRILLCLSVQENPDFIIPYRSLELDTPQTSLQLNLHKDLGLNVYRAKRIQELIINNVVSFVIGSLKCMKTIIIRPISTWMGTSKSKTVASRAQKNPRFIVEKPLYLQNGMVYDLVSLDLFF